MQILHGGAALRPSKLQGLEMIKDLMEDMEIPCACWWRAGFRMKFVVRDFQCSLATRAKATSQ